MRDTTEIPELNGTAAAQAAAADRFRWIALVVLCAGMLMIVLDSSAQQLT